MVVNCFQKTCIFALWNNLSVIVISLPISCELLSKNLYLCSLKQPRWNRQPCKGWLWIAFKKLVSLLFETTPTACVSPHTGVVNCFQKTCIFALWNNQAACKPSATCRCELLSKNLYLCSLKQPLSSRPPAPACCELLSKNLYLCSLKQPWQGKRPMAAELWIAFKKLVSLLFETTQSYRQSILSIVVNCFQKTCIFALWNNPSWKSTSSSTCCELLSKNLYLCSLKQPFILQRQGSLSCELLSKNLYLCSLKQPMPRRWLRQHLLWIAFKKLVSLLFETTLCILRNGSSFVVNCFQKTCIFALWNNCKKVKQPKGWLWIAFKKLVSLLFETTGTLTE